MSDPANDTSHAGIDLVYEQGPCLGVIKPAGLLTQAPPGIDSLEARLKAFLKARHQKPGNIYLGVPHRLDRPVSGIMVFARHARAACRISKQFEARLVEKRYWACVQGEVSPLAGTWTDYMFKIPGQPRAQVAAAEQPQARLAVLHYRTLACLPWGSWLEIQLQTGRTHQVRVQAASRGHPVLGDAFYGSCQPFGEQFADERQRAIALHARFLQFQHPMTRDLVALTAPLPGNWASLALPELPDSPAPW